MNNDLYVYYQVAESDAAEFQPDVIAMQASLGVAASLARRPEIEKGRHTWMEVYRGVPEDFTARLASAVEQAGLARHIIGGRHVEYFLEVSTCA